MDLLAGILARPPAILKVHERAVAVGVLTNDDSVFGDAHRDLPHGPKELGQLRSCLGEQFRPAIYDHQLLPSRRDNAATEKPS
jgi:hypothetical protein